MRRALVGAIVVLLIGVAAAPVQAGKKSKPRTLEMTYTEPAHGTAGVGVCFQGTSCAFFGEEERR